MRIGVKARAVGAVVTFAAALVFPMSQALANTCANGICLANPSTAIARANPLKLVGLSVANEQDLVQRFETQSKDRRSTVFMTAVDEKGDLYSHVYGQIGLKRKTLAIFALMIMFATGLLYLVFKSVSPVGQASPGERDANQADPLELAPTVVPVLEQAAGQSSVIAVPPSSTSSTSQATWSQLVLACQGDPVRAAKIIEAEVAIDPKLTADSPEALTRAIARFHPA
jgi:hypothetical protein